MRLGYEGAIIKPPSRLTKTQQGMIQQPQGPVAFLTFSTRKDAELAKEKFQGFQLDPDAPHISLKLEFAKVNFVLRGWLEIKSFVRRQIRNHAIVHVTIKIMANRSFLEMETKCCMHYHFLQSSNNFQRHLLLIHQHSW